MISGTVKNKIEELTGSTVLEVNSVTGGCISSAYKINLSGKNSVFAKINPECCNDIFIKEANGLKELAKAGAIRVPQVISADKTFIVMENIAEGKRRKDFFEDFGEKFANLHKTSAKSFGFKEDNFIGSTEQLNIPEGSETYSWAEFYLHKRIQFQYKLAEKNGFADSELRMVIANIENRIYDILNGSEESPSLLHGDLWGGNYITDESGSVCLIDPAVYYGHREADLAMTKLFGGFHNAFYSAYQQSFPLPNGYRERENIYKLYHALNHLNLFGQGYYNLSLSLAKYYL